MQTDPLAVLLEPAAQRRPAADQDLVCDLGRAVVKGDEPRLVESLEQAPDGVRRATGLDQLLDPDAAPRVLDVITELGEAQEDVAQHGPIAFRRSLDHGVGGTRDRLADATTRVVCGDGERPPVAALPRFAQRVGHEREGAGLAGDVSEHEVDETGFEPEAGLSRRLGDRASQVLVAHRAEQHLVVRHGRGRAQHRR